MEVQSTATSAESKLPDMNVNEPEVEEKIEVQSMGASADSESNLPDVRPCCSAGNRILRLTLAS